MSAPRALALAGAVFLVVTLSLAAQRAQQPSLNFGSANISLGMTVQEAQTLLTEARQHFRFIRDEPLALRTLTIGSDEGGDEGGQITFSDGRAVFVEYQMPTAHSADALAQEIAGAVDSMETKTCSVSNYSAHGTGGVFSQSIFQCGPKTFNVMTTQLLGSTARDVNVTIEIGHLGKN
jgi:hypothetical protein